MEQEQTINNAEGQAVNVDPMVGLNCYFQYFANGKMVEDTSMITEESGLALIEKYKNDFTNHCKMGHVAEMALWVEMNTDSDYRKTKLHINSDDMIFRDGDLYQLSRVFV